MPDRDRDVRETLIELVLALKKRGYNMVNDAVDDIADEIRALDLPLTSAREVTDVDIERAAEAMRADYVLRRQPNKKGWAEIDEEMRDMWRQHARSALQSFVASAPQPACVGVGEEAALKEMQGNAGLKHPPTRFTFDYRRAISGEGSRAGDWADKPHRLVYDLCTELERLAALSPAPSPQAGAMHCPTCGATDGLGCGACPATCDRCGKVVAKTEGSGSDELGTFWCNQCCYDEPNPGGPDALSPRREG